MPDTSSATPSSAATTAIINTDALTHGKGESCHTELDYEVNRWTVDEIVALFELPFSDLMHRAQTVHRAHFDPNAVQVSTLLSIKTGGCSEDCGYCPQAARYHTDVDNEPLMKLDDVLAAAQAAKDNGASRFCMGAAWRGPKQRDLEPVLKMRSVDINVCCGGIIGMGESRNQRAGLLAQLANMERPPESVPINLLTQVEGTPLHGTEELDPLEFVRTIAAARITMPQSFVRLSAGRQSMHEGIQALCFLAGANSIFYGEKLLTTGNPEAETDKKLFAKLGIHPI
jgi:biotin synthase